MSYFDHVFILARCCLSIWAAFFLFSGPLEKRPGYALKFCAAFAAEASLALLFPLFYHGGTAGWQFTLVLMGMTAILALWFWVAYHISFVNDFFYAFLAFLTCDLADSVFFALYFPLRYRLGISWLSAGSPPYHIFYYLVLLATYLIVYRFAGSKVRLQRELGDRPQIFLLPLASTLIAFPLFGALRLTLTRGGSSEELAAYLHVLYDVTIIAYCYILLERVRSRLEASALQRTQEMERKQYEGLKESMEAIRLTSHDLKYQLRCLRETGGLPPQQLREAEQALEVYESVFHTGSRPLDLILSDRKLRCEAKRIDFTCMADAAQLDFMEPADLYSLFCNALDNAIEYEETIPDEEARFIHLSVHPEARLLFIHVENSYIGPPLTGTSLETSKTDKDRHGYGLKSIQRTVDRYSGQMDWKTEDGLFSLNVVFPLPTWHP